MDSKISKKEFYDIEVESYEKKPDENINGFQLYPKYTNTIKIYIKNKNIVVAIRGTADTKDIKADIRIANGSLYKSNRYLEDKKFLLEIQKIFSPSQYKYYGVGHSLGSAILDQLIDDGLIISGISYNGAVENKFLNNTKNHRIYNEDDILYNLMGQYTKHHEVRKNKLNWKQKIAKLIPLGKIGVGIQAHLLSNFVGGVFHHYLILK